MASSAKKKSNEVRDPNKPTQSKEWDMCVRKGALTIGAGMIAGAAIGSVLAATIPVLWGTGISVAWSIKRCRALMRDGIVTPEMERERKKRERQRKDAEQRIKGKHDVCCKKAEELEKRLKEKCGTVRETDSEKTDRRTDRTDKKNGKRVAGRSLGSVQDENTSEQQYRGGIRDAGESSGYVQDELPYCDEISGTGESVSSRPDNDTSELPYCDEIEEKRPFEDNCPEDQQPTNVIKETKEECEDKCVSKPTAECDEEEKDESKEKEEKDCDETGNVANNVLKSYSTIKLFAAQTPQTSSNVQSAKGKCTCDARESGDEYPCPGCNDLSRSYDGNNEPTHLTIKDDGEERQGRDIGLPTDSAQMAKNEDLSDDNDEKSLGAYDSRIELPAMIEQVGSLQDPDDLFDEDDDDDDDDDDDEDEEYEEYLELTEETEEFIEISESNSDMSESSDGWDSSSADDSEDEVFVENIKHDPSNRGESLEEETTFSAETYKKSSWPFSFALPSAEKFQKKSNTFKWPPLPSSIILKPKKESTCTCDTTSVKPTCSCRPEDECTCP